MSFLKQHTVQHYIDIGALEIGDGYRAMNSELGTEGIPFARAGNIDGGFNFEGADRFPAERLSVLGPKVSHPGDTLFTSKGTVGRIAFVTEDTPQFVYSPQLCYWRSRSQNIIAPKFLNIWMRGSEFSRQTDYLKGQTDMADYVSLRDQRRMIITLPTINEQRRIADIIFAFDNKIELNRQINQTLEQMAQTIFQSWFVDFAPVKAKVAALAEGRDPLRAAMCAISGKTDAELDELPDEQFDPLAATAALFPEKMVDAEMGEIPEGWQFSTIGQEVSVLGGGTPSTTNAEYWDGEFAWVTPRDLSRLSDNVLINTERRITAEGVRKISSGQLPVGTVLLSSRAPIGYLALSMIPVSINQGFIAMVCDKRLPNTYALQWAVWNLNAIKQRGSGTTFPEVSKTNFRPMSVLVPDAQILMAFHSLTMPLYEKIAVNARGADALAALRDSLLPKLLSGELSVSAVAEASIVAPFVKTIFRVI